jgi:hypothetical protein
VTADLWVLTGLAVALIALTLALALWPQRDGKRTHAAVDDDRAAGDDTDVWAIIARIEHEDNRHERRRLGCQGILSGSATGLPPVPVVPAGSANPSRAPGREMP